MLIYTIKILNIIIIIIILTILSSRSLKFFGKPLLVYLETLQQVAKIDHAQGQIQFLKYTCTLFPSQDLFRSSYFLNLRWFLC